MYAYVQNLKTACVMSSRTLPASVTVATCCVLVLLPVAACWCCCLLLLCQLLIRQPTMSDQQLILKKCACQWQCVCVLLGKWRLIYLGTIFWVLVANKVVSLDVSDIWAVEEEFGVFCKRIVGFLQIKWRATAKKHAQPSDHPEIREIKCVGCKCMQSVGGDVELKSIEYFRDGSGVSHG